MLGTNVVLIPKSANVAYYATMVQFFQKWPRLKIELLNKHVFANNWGG